jgi:diguanylate cyclase (GGDEF)-like protein
MKQLILRMLDTLVPAHIKEFEKAEELARARALIFLESLVLLFSVIGLIGGLITFYIHPTPLTTQAPYPLAICVLGYAFSIWLFQRTGRYALSGNVFAFFFFTSICAGTVALHLTGQELIGCLLYLLALPLLVTLIAGYTSGIVWVGAVAIAPLLLCMAGDVQLRQFFLANWVALCLGLFIAIHTSQAYLERLSQRFTDQNTWLEFAAAHDSLTGITNRAAFEQYLFKSIEFCKSHATQAVLVYIDLDKFKPINDIYGHQAGDIVLITTADRLLHLARRTDIVARIGGDEFAILFDQCNPTSIQPFIDRIASVVSAPVDVYGKLLSVGCSFGVVVCPDDGSNADQLQQKADERMYEAKRKNDANWQPTDPAAVHFLAAQRRRG